MPNRTTFLLILSAPSNRQDLATALENLSKQAGPFNLHCHIPLSADPELEAEFETWDTQFSQPESDLACASIKLTTSPDSPEDTRAVINAAISQSQKTDLISWMDIRDELTTGALAFVADAIQRFSPAQVSWINGSQNPYFSKSILRAQICDDALWPNLSPAGVFFRPWLWNKASKNIDAASAPSTFFSDLWSELAQSASIISTAHPLVKTGTNAGPAKTPSHTPQEIKDTFSTLATNKAKDAHWRFFEDSDVDARLLINRHDWTPQLAEKYANLTGETLAAFAAPPLLPKQIGSADPVPVLPLFQQLYSRKGGIYVYDSDWQYPAITEQHAYQQLTKIGAVPEGVTYVAYPWATLFDKLHRASPDRNDFLDHFRKFCARLPKDTIKVTVCQHIKMKEFLKYFKECGISEIFWTHTTYDDLAAGRQDGLRFHAFPLFPVQTKDYVTPPQDHHRPNLFSFIGAKANQHYLTESRNWILDLLADHPRGQIIGRDSWHYNKVVYDHQVKVAGGARDKAKDFIDNSASDQFKTSLLETVFSLCPSGSGPNSIRLWETLGAGSIPVILADSYAPPGNPALWEQAAVFCRETPADILALPARLEELANSPETLERMRHVGHQLWLLYGPNGFIADLQTLLYEAVGGASETQISFPAVVANKLAKKPDLTLKDAELFVHALSAHLLTTGETDVYTPDMLQVEMQTFELLTQDHAAVRHLQATKSFRRKRLSAPGLNTRNAISVCLWGQHSNRTPLSYAPLRKELGNKVLFETRPEDADIIISGYHIDFQNNIDEMRTLASTGKKPQLAILSEEPLWDTIWNARSLTERRTTLGGENGLSYHFLNHLTTSIYDFEHIPYFVLTDSKFAARYSMMLTQYLDMSPKALLSQWQAASIPAAFFAEVREKGAYERSYKELSIDGLSVYRTDVAKHTQLDNTLREGRGWDPEAKRQSLPDWHCDKIAHLTQNTRICSAFENTHLHSYISEKIFDAFAVGGIPTYYADAQHRVHDLIPDSSILNTYGLTAPQAAAKLSTFIPDTAFAESWLGTARNLRNLFRNADLVIQERQRVAQAVVAELETCLSLN